MSGGTERSQRPPTARGRQGREKILTAAMEYFSREGVGDVSLRGIAAEIGTSHRMIIYHFGSREGLLAAVVDRFTREQQELLQHMVDHPDGTVGPIEGFWGRLVEAGSHLAPLYFELASQAMHHRRGDHQLDVPGVSLWMQALREYWQRMGTPHDQVDPVARIDYAVSLGLLHDLMLTGERDRVNEAMALFNRTMRATFGSSGPPARARAGGAPVTRSHRGDGG